MVIIKNLYSFLLIRLNSRKQTHLELLLRNSIQNTVIANQRRCRFAMTVSFFPVGGIKNNHSFLNSLALQKFIPFSSI